jgi:2-polyprenyl-3-methyl-5-hydroxy-6-metoxy-1,4-benzoquinol methylase
MDKNLQPNFLIDISTDHLKTLETYDAIFCFEVFEHVKDIDSAMNNFKI